MWKSISVNSIWTPSDSIATSTITRPNEVNAFQIVIVTHRHMYHFKELSHGCLVYRKASKINNPHTSSHARATALLEGCSYKHLERICPK